MARYGSGPEIHGPAPKLRTVSSGNGNTKRDVRLALDTKGPISNERDVERQITSETYRRHNRVKAFERRVMGKKVTLGRSLTRGGR